MAVRGAVGGGVRAGAPSGEYNNVTVRLTDITSASSASPTKIAEFDLPLPIAVSPRMAQETIVMVGMTPGEDVPMRYVRALFEGRSVEGVELMLSGVFASHVTTTMASGEVTTRYPATYYCWPVTIAVGGSSSSSSPDYTSFVVTDAPCMDESEAPAIV
ncbi:hypothetical protein TRIUR3_30291 [Triticum urartu]|uniref:Uncharacterized protein n=2 Tax=Triticum TaxID=4564 RepID=A0A9R1BKI2_TRITD|nr:hypothetical protein TRIUR3_30291 [Triticum urartu]VAI72014.1 unnamed protein product [Triticum turgidum subsp. durum]